MRKRKIKLLPGHGPHGPSRKDEYWQIPEGMLGEHEPNCAAIPLKCPAGMRAEKIKGVWYWIGKGGENP